MAYDLLIKNGRIIDGSGMPAFRGDVGIRNGKIVEMGKIEDGNHTGALPGRVVRNSRYNAAVAV